MTAPLHLSGWFRIRLVDPTLDPDVNSLAEMRRLLQRIAELSFLGDLSRMLITPNVIILDVILWDGGRTLKDHVDEMLEKGLQVMEIADIREEQTARPRTDHAFSGRM